MYLQYNGGDRIWSFGQSLERKRRREKNSGFLHHAQISSKIRFQVQSVSYSPVPVEQRKESKPFAPMVISEQDKRIEELTAELENASQRSEAYRASLLAVLKDMEEEKLKIAVKVQNTRLNLKG